MVFYVYIMKKENNLQQVWQNTTTWATCSYNYILAPVLWILSVLWWWCFTKQWQLSGQHREYILCKYGPPIYSSRWDVRWRAQLRIILCILSWENLYNSLLRIKYLHYINFMIGISRFVNFHLKNNLTKKLFKSVYTSKCMGHINDVNTNYQVIYSWWTICSFDTFELLID